MHRAAVLLAPVLALAACGGGPGAPDVTGEWQFVEGTANGAALPRPPGASATLELSGEEARGVSFCNQFFSSYRLSGTSFSIDGIGGTEIGCEPDVMAAETAYVSALGVVDSALVDDDDLLLTGDGVELRFTAVAPVPDIPLEGTRWVLESVIDGELVSSTVGGPAILVLTDDGNLSAQTGCRDLRGTWTLEGDVLHVTDLSTEGACPADVRRQDAHVTSVLDSGPRAEITENRLTLTAPDGTGLGYRGEG